MYASSHSHESGPHKYEAHLYVSGKMHASETPYIFPWVKGKLQINLEQNFFLI